MCALFFLPWRNHVTCCQWYVAGLFTIWLGLVSSFQNFDVIAIDPTSHQYTPLTFLDVSTQRLGVPASRAFYTIVAANAASGAGRISSGYWADLLGHINVLLIFSAIAAVMCIAWPYVEFVATRYLLI